MRIDINILDQEFSLFANNTMLWKEHSALIISDVHLGKASHFQKFGLPVPSIKGHEDLSSIAKIIFDIRPKRVIFLGDLFHSISNKEWDWFEKWLDHFPETEFLLIEGNHDTDIVKNLPVKISATAEVTLNGIILTHEPLNNIPEDHFNIAGHIHPGVVLRGKGRQSIKLPCFWKAHQQLIMPAFGNLTGAVKMPTKNVEIYATAENEIFKI